tara:strand:- start:1329 stop:1871 length:543 start_codon:yes stop_codon:yes gene_type:complete
MYFDRFPMMTYDVKGNGQLKLLPNILRRVKIRSGLKSGLFLFDKYDVPMGDKPEDTAFKYYGDAEFHWVILITNDITDRYYQWPMTQPQFDEFLTDKYGAGNEDAIHHYEITQRSGRTSGQGPDDFSHLVEVNSDEEGASSVSNRQYEERIQDKHRQIRLLDPKYLSAFIEEFYALVRKK